jgi:mannosyltransferase
VVITAQQRGMRRLAAEGGFDRTITVSAVILGALAVLLSAAGSWIPSLWGDEVTSVLSAERSLPSLFTMLGHVDAVHGTYYVFLHFWVDVFGASPFSVRFPSAIAVGLMVAGVVLLGSRLGGLRMGVIGGMVAVIVPRTTYMGEETRGYAMSAACAVWLTLLLVKLVSDLSPRRRLWILYGVGVAVCGYVFLFSLLVLVAHAVLVISLHRRSLAKTWAKSLGVGLALALPVIIYGASERGQIAFLADRSDATFRDITVGQWFENDLTAILAWGLIMVAIVVPTVAVVRLRLRPVGALIPAITSRSPRFTLLVATWAIAPTVMLVAINAVHPIYSSRYLSFCVPAVALLISSLLTRFRRTWITGAIILILCATAVGSYLHDRGPYAKNGSDWAADAAVIQSNARAGDAIIFDESTKPSKDPRLAMGAYPSAFAGLTDVEIKSPWYETTGWHDTVYPLAAVTDRLDGISTVWVIEYRASGTAPDTYDLSELGDLGYSVTRTFSEHSSVVLELEN